MVNTLAVQILHFLVPISALAATVACRVVATNETKPGKQRSRKVKASELPLRVLQLCSALSYFGELIISAVRTWWQERVLLPDDAFIYLAGSGIIFLYLSLNKKSGMHHYLVSSVATAVFEVILYLISAPLSTMTLIWHIARISIFILVAALTLAHLCQTPSVVDDREREPLMNGQANEHAKVGEPDDGNDSDADGEFCVHPVG